MTADERTQVRALFDRALGEPPDRRSAFLSSASDVDEAIRREVASLLEAYEAAGGFLETPAFRVTGDAPSALEPGDRIGHFEVVELVGRGGMGEVYRARDARLGRDVAIKVLPRSFADDPQRLMRFERESRVLASLNHPNIASIHSVEQAGSLRILVMELVEGPTLADRLQAGPLPATEALAIARELAAALEATHERGLVHRDLKPANVKLTSPAGLKLLDFGLAKDVVADSGDSTTDGLILGTCAYMSPEQARGKSVDKRADIWAFGCVLFEMLSGTRAFSVDTSSDTMAAVLEREPDWSRLPDTTSADVRRLLRRCLEKDVNDRLHDIADARLEIDEARSIPSRPPIERRRLRLSRVLTGIALLAAAAAAGWWLHAATNRPTTPATTRFTWSLPKGLILDSAPAVSPDGRRIAFVARASVEVPAKLFVRPIDQLEAQPVAGTDGAKQPFWSPDGRSLAYFARGKLMKVAIAGGAPVEICAAPDARGGAWGSKGIIVFEPLNIESGLQRVPESGGAAEPVTLLDVAQGENSHRWPAFLPDGIHFLYFVRSLVEERRGVYLGRVDRPASTAGTPLFRSESEAVYAPGSNGDDDLLLTVAGGRIEAHRFDVRRLAVTSDPQVIDLPTAGNGLYHAALLGVSQHVLAHAAAALPYGARLSTALRNRNNDEAPSIVRERGPYNWPRLSPDGTRLAYAQLDDAPGKTDLWVEDLSRGSRVRVSRTLLSVLPVWSPDGDRLVHRAHSVQKGVVTISAADGTRDISTLPCPGERCDPSDWSSDGRWILATVLRGRDQDVWMLPAAGHGEARPLLTQPFPERDARLSRDGRLVAYVSLETTRPEISVQTVADTPQREVISVTGGTQPVWSRSGRELFFVDLEGKLRALPVTPGADGRPHFGKSAILPVPPIGTGHFGTQYDVSPDGNRLYFLDRTMSAQPSELGVVVGWRALLK